MLVFWDLVSLRAFGGIAYQICTVQKISLLSSMAFSGIILLDVFFPFTLLFHLFIK